MRRWLLFLNMFLLVAVAGGVYWLYASWGSEGRVEEMMPVVRESQELRGVELPEMPEEIDRVKAEYAIVYEKTLFKKNRRYIEPESTITLTPSPLDETLPNIRLGGIVLGGPSTEAKVYFEVEQVVEKQTGSRKTVQSRTREMKAFSRGEQIASGWRLVGVTETEVELERAGEVKVIVLGKASEFDRMPMPQLPKLNVSPIREAPRPVGRRDSSAGRPPRPPEAKPSPVTGQQAKAKQGPIVVTSGETPFASRPGEVPRVPPKVMPVEDKLVTQAVRSDLEKQEALEKLKKLREYVKKRQEEEGKAAPRR